MKIALAQINYLIGDFEGNTARILRGIEEARTKGADLVVFAELSVCGYPPRDFLEFGDFLRQSEEAVKQIAGACHGIAAIVGAPSPNPADKGKPLYNSAFFLEDGRIQAVVHKTLLPNYDVFDEYRYFEPNRLPFRLIPFKGKKIALTICEDLWNITDDPLYVVNPMEELSKLGPDLAINIAASPFHYDQAILRREVLSRNASTYRVPLFYVNHVGAQTELLFDGGSMVLDSSGNVTGEMKCFEEGQEIFTLEEPGAPVDAPAAEDKISRIHSALVMGIRDYFQKLGFSQATLGLSGGIDSAVTLVLAVEALGRHNVIPLLLPSHYSSSHSLKDAADLAQTLKTPYHVLSISDCYNAVEETLDPWFAGMPFNIAEENIQARLRALFLMAFSNKFGYVLLNTSNKSEAAVGYGTLYGDMCGGLSVLGDLYKTQVYDLARYINRNGEVIPENTILKPPSAELRPNQKDSDSLPEYDILDEILFQYIEQRKGPNELIAMGFDEKTVRRVLKLVNTNEYKRYQTPPILRVSPKAFGSGRRLPIVAKYLS